MVGVLGLEPRTSALSGLRSSQLSYTPEGAGVYLPGAKRQARARPGGASRADPRLPDHLLSDAPISDPLNAVCPATQAGELAATPSRAVHCICGAERTQRHGPGRLAHGAQKRHEPRDIAVAWLVEGNARR